MRETKIDPLWGEACEAIQLQALPDQRTLEAIERVQQHIASSSAVALRPIPTHCLHMTVLTLLHPMTDFGRSKFAIWAENAESWQSIVSTAVSETPHFSITFDRIVYSQMAIILQAPVPPELLAVRQQMAQAISLEDWHPRPPDIAHITLFRYAQEGVLPEHDEVRLDVPLLMRVDSLRLIRETVYPTLEAEPIAQFSLGDAS
jgi:hypothetical protein